MTWDEYKDWEKDEKQFEQIEAKHLEAKEKIGVIVNFEEAYQHAYKDLEQQNDMDSMMRVLSKDLEDLLTKLGTENFNYVGLYME